MNLYPNLPERVAQIEKTQQQIQQHLTRLQTESLLHNEINDLTSKQITGLCECVETLCDEMKKTHEKALTK